MSSTVTIDGGATVGRARLHVTGQTSVTVTGPALSITTVAVEVVVNRILELISALPIVDSTTVDAVSIGLAGGTASERTQRVAAAVRSRYPSARVAVGRDVDLLLARLCGHGVAVIAGTGAAVLAIGRRGEVLVDGRGFALGDRGSASWIGLEAVRQALRAVDVFGEESALLSALRSQLGLASDRGFATALSAGGGPDAARVASLAPVVLDLATGGDCAAEGIVTNAVNELSETVRVARRRAEVDRGAPVVVAGGLTRSPDWCARLWAQLQAQSGVGELTIVDPLDGSISLSG